MSLLRSLEKAAAPLRRCAALYLVDQSALIAAYSSTVESVCPAPLWTLSRMASTARDAGRESDAGLLHVLRSELERERWAYSRAKHVSRGIPNPWTLRGKQGGGKRKVFFRESGRTFSCHGKHDLLGSALTEARSSIKIRHPFPSERGLLPLLSPGVRHISTQPAIAAKQRDGREERSETGITTQEDPFDTLTDKIPVQPVSVVEGASYSVAILAGLAVAVAAAYTIFKELIVEPKEYKVYGKALDRVQKDMQVAGRLGSPIHGYGQESQNRAARQRISNRQWVDEDGVEHVEVMFHVRGPGGGGKVFSEMFKDPEDKSWKFTYLIVDVTHPTPKRFLLESYVPQVKVNLSPV